MFETNLDIEWSASVKGIRALDISAGLPNASEILDLAFSDNYRKGFFWIILNLTYDLGFKLETRDCVNLANDTLYIYTMSYNTKVLCRWSAEASVNHTEAWACMQARNTERFVNFTDYGNGNDLVFQTVLTWLIIS